MIYSVKCNVSKKDKKYLCLVDEENRIISVERQVINSIVGLYCFDNDKCYEKTINDLYTCSLIIHITVERS